MLFPAIRQLLLNTPSTFAMIVTRRAIYLMTDTATNNVGETDRHFTDMDEWFGTPLGQELLKTESSLLKPILGRRFGYHLLQLGCSNTLLYASSPIGHKFSIAPHRAELKHTAIAKSEAIPLASESLDLVLLHHALDFAENQHQLLREVSRTIITGGHVVILGFNPLSSWGIRHKLQWRKSPPWDGKPLTTLRVTDWLRLLDFQIEKVSYGLYSLPVNSPKVIKYSSIMDALATRLNWPSGGIYIISAKKQSIPLTPIQMNWKKFPANPAGISITENITRATRTVK